MRAPHSYYRNSEELGISDKDLTALHSVLADLESGRMKHGHPFSRHPVRALLVATGLHEPYVMFNMDTWDTKSDCGTVYCIGGAASARGAEFLSFPGRNENLEDLFYVKCLPDTSNMYDITAEQAAAALRNYLTTGKAGWEDILRVR